MKNAVCDSLLRLLSKTRNRRNNKGVKNVKKAISILLAISVMLSLAIGSHQRKATAADFKYVAMDELGAICDNAGAGDVCRKIYEGPNWFVAYDLGYNDSGAFNMNGVVTNRFYAGQTGGVMTGCSNDWAQSLFAMDCPSYIAPWDHGMAFGGTSYDMGTDNIKVMNNSVGAAYSSRIAIQYKANTTGIATLSLATLINGTETIKPNFAAEAGAGAYIRMAIFDQDNVKVWPVSDAYLEFTPTDASAVTDAISVEFEMEKDDTFSVLFQTSAAANKTATVEVNPIVDFDIVDPDVVKTTHDAYLEYWENAVEVTYDGADQHKIKGGPNWFLSWDNCANQGAFGTAGLDRANIWNASGWGVTFTSGDYGGKATAWAPGMDAGATDYGGTPGSAVFANGTGVDRMQSVGINYNPTRQAMEYQAAESGEAKIFFADLVNAASNQSKPTLDSRSSSCGNFMKTDFVATGTGNDAGANAYLRFGIFKNDVKIWPVSENYKEFTPTANTPLSGEFVLNLTLNKNDIISFVFEMSGSETYGVRTYLRPIVELSAVIGGGDYSEWASWNSFSAYSEISSNASAGVNMGPVWQAVKYTETGDKDGADYQIDIETLDKITAAGMYDASGKNGAAVNTTDKYLSVKGTGTQKSGFRIVSPGFGKMKLIPEDDFRLFNSNAGNTMLQIQVVRGNGDVIFPAVGKCEILVNKGMGFPDIPEFEVRNGEQIYFLVYGSNETGDYSINIKPLLKYSGSIGDVVDETITYEDSATGLIIKYPVDAFPDGVTFTVKKEMTGSAFNSALKLIKDQTPFLSYLITVTAKDSQGNVIQPDGMVEIWLPTASEDGSETTLVYFMYSDEGVDMYATVEDGYIRFYTAELGSMAVVDVQNGSTPDSQVPVTGNMFNFELILLAAIGCAFLSVSVVIKKSNITGGNRK